MLLIQSPFQEKNIYQLYQDRVDTGSANDVEIGNGMLLFIELLNQTFLKTEIFALTSHYNLVLVATNDKDAAWLISVGCTPNGEYIFEYEMPEDKRPWPYASVRGVAQNWTEARKYLIIAMHECEGWVNSEELKTIYPKAIQQA